MYIVYLWSALESHSVSTVNTDRSADKIATNILYDERPEESWLKHTCELLQYRFYECSHIGLF